MSWCFICSNSSCLEAFFFLWSCLIAHSSLDSDLVLLQCSSSSWLLLACCRVTTLQRFIQQHPSSWEHAVPADVCVNVNVANEQQCLVSPFLSAPMIVARSDESVDSKLNLNGWDVGCCWSVWFVSEMVSHKCSKWPAMERNKMNGTKTLNTPPFKQSEQCTKCRPMVRANKRSKAKEFPWGNGIDNRGIPPRIGG